MIIEWFSSALKECLHAENNEVNHFSRKERHFAAGPPKELINNNISWFHHDWAHT